jgi:hypothetical protein
LASALAATTWGDRILGRSETVVLPQRATWVATGNNIRLGGDMPRRCYLIRLDAKVARPWERGGWKIPELSRWALQHRGELIAALLTIARAWYAGGCKESKTLPLGTFEVWSRILGNILAHAGYQDFLVNRDDLYSDYDADGGQWEAFFDAWDSAFRDRSVTVADIIRELTNNSNLRDAVPDWLADDYYKDAGKFRRQLGQALARQRGAQYGPWRLEKPGTNRRNVSEWRVVQVTTGDAKAA